MMARESKYQEQISWYLHILPLLMAFRVDLSSRLHSQIVHFEMTFSSLQQIHCSFYYFTIIIQRAWDSAIVEATYNTLLGTAQDQQSSLLHAGGLWVDNKVVRGVL